MFTSEAGFARAQVRRKVALALRAAHAVLGPTRTLVVLALLSLVSVVEETLAGVLVRAVS